MKKKRLCLIWGPALILLTVVLILANRPSETPLPVGAAEGERMPAFRAVCTDDRVFDLAAQNGKVTVINLWATWCAPCVKELQYFERLQREYPEDVTVLALHSPPVTADVESWLADFSYSISFAVDEDGRLSAALNSSAVLPQTVIIDADGVVTYNRSGALSYKELEELVSAAKK